MHIRKLTVYQREDIQSKSRIIKHKNAFIKPNGEFILARGYTGLHPSEQIEKSATRIAKEITTTDIRKEYEEYLQSLWKMGREKEALPQFRYLRDILVHYYGYAMFARREKLNQPHGKNHFIDYSMIPNVLYCGKEVTSDQIKTLRELFNLNDDGTLDPTFFAYTKEEHFQKVLTHRNDYEMWKL